MKTLVLAMTMLLSAQSFASTSCDSQVLEHAQSTLDAQAREYGFEKSDIAAETLEQIDQLENATYSVEGYIYKATYSVIVEVDSACNLVSSSTFEVL